MQEARSFKLPDELPPLHYDETTWEWQIHTNYISYSQADACSSRAARPARHCIGHAMPSILSAPAPRALPPNTSFLFALLHLSSEGISTSAHALLTKQRGEIDVAVLLQCC